MPRRAPDRFVEVLARYSYPHARAIEKAIGSAERFEALTLAEQLIRGLMLAGNVFEKTFVHSDAIDLRTALLDALADVVGEEAIRESFGDGTCDACGGDVEAGRVGDVEVGRVRFCQACDEDQLAGVVFPWVK